jgi:opacity protein-like surface antigen
MGVGVFAKFVIRTLIITPILFTRCAFAADGAFPWLDEVRVGVMSSASNGLSASGELQALFSPLDPVAKPYDPNWAWVFSPRPLIGASISLEGKTNQAYAGLAWNLPISGPYFVEVSAGGLVHDQNLNQTYNDRPSPLTTRFLFRESIAIGYEINANWRVLAFADHGSDGNLGYRNEGVNRFGLLLGEKFEASTNKPITADSPISTFSWAGPYAGFGVGLARGKYDLISPTPSDLTEHDDSVNIAAQVGYNWVFDSAVMGGEFDYSVQGLNGSANINASDAAVSASSLWLTTARGRIGTDVEIPFVSIRSLIYGTGGVAISRIANNYCLHASMQCYTGSTRDIAGGWAVQAAIRSGWTAGAGIELPLAPMVTAKFEYLYIDFGNISFNNGAFSDEITFSEQIFRTGMNFKLN